MFYWKLVYEQEVRAIENIELSYIGIIKFRFGSIFVEFVRTSHPRINISYEFID